MNTLTHFLKMVSEHLDIAFIVFTCLTIVVSNTIWYKRFKKATDTSTERITVDMETKITERTKALAQVNEQREHSVVSLAYMLRNPLTILNNCLNEYINGFGTNEKLTQIKRSAERLTDYINRFLKEDIFLHGKPAYEHNQSVNFSDFLAGKITSFAEYAQKKGVTLTSQIEKCVFIDADPVALHSITGNLIENALKYTPPKGKVTVSLTVLKEKITFSVADTGCGIPKKLQQKVFDPYFQVYNKGVPAQGIGMGLYIVNNCINSLGWSIKLASKKNRGSTFTVGLNRYTQRADTCPAPAKIRNYVTSVDDSTSPLPRTSILVVDDDPEMLFFFRETLRNYFNVYVATDQKQALTKLQQINWPDLIISDISTDETKGIEFLKAISNNNKYYHIPFLFVTASTSEKIRNTAYSLGAIYYVRKPFDIWDLLMKINAIINHNKKQLNFVRSIAYNSFKEEKAKADKEDEAAKRMKKYEANCIIYNITKREREVILLLDASHTQKEIACILCISENTARKHCENIYFKTGVTNKLDLIKKIFS
jgi:DNA-binding NarL/FixJ family response regulator/two-component sensor histidine kinase